MNQNVMKKIGVVFAAIAILVAGVFAWQYATSNENESTEPTSSQEDCEEDLQCFYEAYTDDCSSSTVKKERTTIEGDPIITTGVLVSSGGDCVVNVSVDGTQDRFGDGEVHTYICHQLSFPGDSLLVASDCEDQPASFSVGF